MFLFFFGNNFYKSKETLRFFLQVLEVYRIFFVKTTLESMLYYTFSVIITTFVPRATQYGTHSMSYSTPNHTYSTAAT